MADVIGENLVGDGAANNLVAGIGSDTLDGAGGNDTLTGGSGSDVFHYISASDGVDKITDFETGNEGDVINITDVLSGYDGTPI